MAKLHLCLAKLTCPHTTPRAVMGRARRGLRRLIEAIEAGRVYAAIEEIRRLRLEVAYRSIQCEPRPQFIKVRVPEPGQYIVVWRKYEGPYTKPFRASIVNATPTQVRSKGRTYTYSFISMGVPSDLRGSKATIRVYKLPP